jgi:hypothetical protein
MRGPFLSDSILGSMELCGPPSLNKILYLLQLVLSIVQEWIVAANLTAFVAVADHLSFRAQRRGSV